MKKYWYKFKALFYKRYIRFRYNLMTRKDCCLTFRTQGTIYDLFALDDYVCTIYFKTSNVDVTQLLDNINNVMIKLSRKFTLHYINYLEWQDIIKYIILHMKKDSITINECITKIPKINLNLDYTIIEEE